MYRKIQKDLTAVDPLNISSTKKFLSQLRLFVESCIKKEDKNSIKQISGVLKEYLSTNRSRFYRDMQNLPSKSFLIRRYLKELSDLINTCETVK